LTAVGDDGYFIPIVPATSVPAATARQSLPAFIGQEFFDHLFPWSRKALAQPRLLQAASLALALLVTWVWVLGAVGKIGPGIVLGWWLAWSRTSRMARGGVAICALPRGPTWLPTSASRTC
jgi:NosR/NirI family nitrous oxide reductase transcriptional regulator